MSLATAALDAGTVRQSSSIHPSTSTLFSTSEFVETWSRSFRGRYRPLTIAVRGSGPPRTISAVTMPSSYGRRFLFLGPEGLYASPGWHDRLDQGTIDGVVEGVQGLRSQGFVWNVRFDHEALAGALIARGGQFRRIPTHVLVLDRSYDDLFAGCSATIRNHVRKAQRRGVIVRATNRPQDVAAYYQMHLKLVQEKGYWFVYPLAFLLDLVRMESKARLLVAEHDGRIVAGCLFVWDGDSIFYFHGAADREFSALHGSCAVIDEALRWAGQSGARFLNLGNSGGIDSLEQFKTSWGAQPRFNWTFEWTNPFWTRLGELKRVVIGWKR